MLISSVAGIKPLANTGDYAAAKAGVVQLGWVAVVEGAKHNIRVVLAPRGVDTSIRDAQTKFQRAVQTAAAIGPRWSLRSARAARRADAVRTRMRWPTVSVSCFRKWQPILQTSSRSMRRNPLT